MRLLEADTSLMQRSGADRVRLLAKSGWADEILLREGAPAKLLALLSKSADQSGHPSSSISNLSVGIASAEIPRMQHLSLVSCRRLDMTSAAVLV